MIPLARFPRLLSNLGVVACLWAALPAAAQNTGVFDEIDAVEELAEIQTRIESEDVN